MSFATQKPTHVISPDDVKVLKEALGYHSRESKGLSVKVHYFLIDEMPEVAKIIEDKALFHTRIAETLRRVVG